MKNHLLSTVLLSFFMLSTRTSLLFLIRVQSNTCVVKSFVTTTPPYQKNRRNGVVGDLIGNRRSFCRRFLIAGTSFDYHSQYMSHELKKEVSDHHHKINPHRHNNKHVSIFVTKRAIMDFDDNDPYDEFGDDSFLASMDMEDITGPKQPSLHSLEESSKNWKGSEYFDDNEPVSNSVMSIRPVQPDVQLATPKIPSTGNSRKETESSTRLVNNNNVRSTSTANTYKRQKVSIVSPDSVNSNPSGSVPATQLQQTLQHYFGYRSFRTGQVEVIQALVEEKRDVAVFWATGQGKSLCYQIPALLPSGTKTNDDRNNIVVVVSPLISLMQDQVHKLNGLTFSSNTGGGREIATYLGSGQDDTTAEYKALQGYYNLIYVTPEKILSSTFMDNMLALHTNPNNPKRIVLFAVDEAHMVSEWGHDFRPDFRRLGQVFRERYQQTMNEIPILALTATAVPRVQTDILQSLRMKPNALRVQQSFDRTNLKIKVLKRPAGGVAVALNDLVNQFKSISASPSIRKNSTIVYAPTRKQVDDIAAYLQSELGSTGIQVDSYHAGLTNDQRSLAHTSFLTGQTSIIVASIAFGMGIDKPDIRQVIHYGSPKTLEEYYQQIGRAGRDGLPATCTMYIAESDFDRYKSDFYLGKLETVQARESVESSMQALRNFALDNETCRRRALLLYFQEVPSFGERCGTCDTCLTLMKHGSDTTRDFGPLGAYVVLQAIAALQMQGLTNIIKVAGGGAVEHYRYKNGFTSSGVKELISNLKGKQPKKCSENFHRELVSPLVQKGYLAESTKSTAVNGYQKAFTVYSLTSLGRRSLEDLTPIELPVPQSIRDEEKRAEENRQRVLEQLEKNGIKRDKLREAEIESGDGEVIRAYSKWYSYLERLRHGNNDDRIGHLESLLADIEEWRSRTAIKQVMAPASVMAEHLLVSIAYTVSTNPPGIKLDAKMLADVGVRTKEIDSLVSILSEWVDKYQPNPMKQFGSTNEMSKKMVLGRVGPNRKWEFAVYKASKATGVSVWEASYIRFVKGESPQSIAINQVIGKQPIQVKTVVGHLLEALEHGRDFDISRLGNYMAPPNFAEWSQLRDAETSSGLSVVSNPSSSGKGGSKWTMSDFLCPIVGEELVRKPFAERTLAENATFSYWCDRLKWYLPLRRVGYEPTFE